MRYLVNIDDYNTSYSEEYDTKVEALNRFAQLKGSPSVFSVRVIDTQPEDAAMTENHSVYVAYWEAN